MADFNPYYYARDLVRAANLGDLSDEEVAKMFRHLFLGIDPHLGEKVLFVLLSWCGEYEMSDLESDVRIPPLDPNELQRWAMGREIANKIKAALYADLSGPVTPYSTNPEGD